MGCHFAPPSSPVLKFHVPHQPGTDDTIFLSSILRLRLWKLLFRYWDWDWDLVIKIFDTDTETETWESQFLILRLRLIPESLTILRLILRLLPHRTMKFQLRLILSILKFEKSISKLRDVKNRYWDWDSGMWKIDTDTETEISKSHDIETISTVHIVRVWFIYKKRVGRKDVWKKEYIHLRVYDTQEKELPW